MKRSSENQDGVTEVFGTILMVAVTVIIASIIAAYMFGVVGGVDKTKSVAATADKGTDGNFHVTYHGGEDARTVTEIKVYNGGTEACFLEPKPGEQCVFIDDTPLEKNHIIVVAKFSDANPQIILDMVI